MQMLKPEFFKALGDETRLKIVKFLLKNQSCTCTCVLTKQIKKDQSVIYRHLMILSQAGIIKAEKQDRCMMCCLKNPNQIKKILEG